MTQHIAAFQVIIIRAAPWPDPNSALVAIEQGAAAVAVSARDVPGRAESHDRPARRLQRRR